MRAIQAHPDQTEFVRMRYGLIDRMALALTFGVWRLAFGAWALRASGFQFSVFSFPTSPRLRRTRRFSVLVMLSTYWLRGFAIRCRRPALRSLGGGGCRRFRDSGRFHLGSRLDASLLVIELVN